MNPFSNLVKVAQGVYNSIFGGGKPAQRPQPVRQGPSQPLPTSVPRVAGNLLVQNVARQGGFTPQFTKTAMATNPQILDRSVMARDYPGPRRYGPAGSMGTSMKIAKDIIDQPSTVVHEAMHAVSANKRPQVVVNQAQKLLSKLSPKQRDLLLRAAGNSTSYAGNLSDYSTANEVLSYATERALTGGNKPIKEFAKPYFNVKDKRFFMPIDTGMYLNYNGPRYGLPKRQNNYSPWLDY